MEPDRWQQVERIYHAAMQSSNDARGDLLDRECAGDLDLRVEIESLLDFGMRTANFFEKPAIEMVAEELARELSGLKDSSSDRLIGTQIGSYRILEKLGAGGMGEVFRARRADDQYEKHVAIKFVRQELNTGSMNARFLRERQILAEFEHENIARLLDGGTTGDGQPYLVMELVEGKPIDDYCDEAKLGIVARIELFRSACSAVQYAHRHLVVHRDIKPNNILVTADGVPKLLDFGIASFLSPETSSPVANPAETGLRILTPQYASPEQLRGETITTATDIYSLGVVLYKLFSGHLPYRLDGSSAFELTRAICETEPGKPSSSTGSAVKAVLPGNVTLTATPEWVAGCRNTTPDKLRRLLSGDLDQIVLKTLRKEPERRYASALDLSEDLRAYSQGLPVSAQRETFAYVAGKFVCRHKFSIAAAAVFLLVGIGGVAAVLREAHIANVQQARAEQRFNDVHALANSLVFDVYDSIRDLPGATAARKLLVDRALKYLDSLSREAGGDANLQRDLAAAYERVGDVQGNPRLANLGDTAGAVDSYKKALEMRQALAATEHDPLDNAELARTYVTLGFLYQVTNNFSNEIEDFQRAYSISERLADRNNKDPKLQEDLAAVCFALGDAFADIGDLTHSVEYYGKSISIRKANTGGSPQFQTYEKSRLAGSYGYMSGVVYLQGDLDQALALQTRAHDILSDLVTIDPNNVTIHEYLLQAEYWVGYYLAKKGIPVRALADFRMALAGYQELTADDPKDSLAKRYLALCYTSQAIALGATGNAAEGIQSGRKGVEISEMLFTKDPSDSFYKLTDVANARAALAETYSRRAVEPRLPNNVKIASWQYARDWYQKSLTAWSAAKQKGHLSRFDAAEPERIAKEIARCDAAVSHYARYHK